MAEQICMLWLRLKGYSILAHRYRTTVGEIDIIARRGSIVAAIEVKMRPTVQQALESLSFRQRQRIGRTLEWWLMKNAKLAGHQLRFDIMSVTRWKINHLTNAWWMET